MVAIALENGPATETGNRAARHDALKQRERLVAKLGSRMAAGFEKLV
jgi:hypothetical protein